MRPRSRETLCAIWQPPEVLNPWQWARDNVDYSRAANYETELKGPYDPNYMPYWQEPVEATTNRDVKEVWIWKNGRAGASENVLLNAIRYAVAMRPQPILYVSGQQASVERFFEKRIKLGFDLARSTRDKYREARIREHEIFFKDLDLIVTWPKNKMAFKQSGYSLILGDEVSVWPEYSAEMLRKRTDNYAFSTILCCSSSDPQQARSSDQDPIVIEFEETDQRYWMMPEPGMKRILFRFEMGGKDKDYGLKWDQAAKGEDGTWDLNRVYKTAHYITPRGRRIDNKDRWSFIQRGRWVPTKKGKRGRRGYHINAFYMPFNSGDFGSIAIAFLEAQSKGPAYLKVFVYETLAEKWYEDVTSANESMVYDRQISYRRGTRLSETDPYKGFYLDKHREVLVTADVQKGHFWVVAREWIEGGTSGLIAWDYVVTFADIDAFANKYGATRVMIDNAYADRVLEVYEASLQYTFIPCVGMDRLSLPFLKQRIDPFEGTHKQGKFGAIMTYKYISDLFRTIAMDMIRGQSPKAWHVYEGVEAEYVNQVTAERKVDGVWQKLRRANHMWDCETIQVLAATIFGLNYEPYLMASMPSDLAAS